MEPIIHEEAVVLLKAADAFLQAIYKAPAFERGASQSYFDALDRLQSVVYNMKGKLS